MPTPNLLTATLCVAALLPTARACARTLGPYQISDSPTSVLLHYEGLAYEVRPPKVYDLTVFADGRATGEILARGIVEWRLSDGELQTLLASLEETGVFLLTTQAIAAAHVEATSRQPVGERRDVGDRETDRLTIRLNGHRTTAGLPFVPLTVDITYDNVGSCALSLPEVRELAVFRDAVGLVHELLRSRYPELRYQGVPAEGA